MIKITKKLLIIGISIFIFTIIFPVNVFAVQTCDWEYPSARTGASCRGNGKIQDQTQCDAATKGGSWGNITTCCCEEIEPIKGEIYYEINAPKLIVNIPGFGGFSKAECKTETGDDGKKGVEYCETNWIGEYISAIYRYAIGIVGILAVAVLMLGGLIWLTSGGSSDKITDAKSWITAGITGLILAVSSYMILNLINPDLVRFAPIKQQSSFQISDWRFDAGIESQTKDASFELNELLDCMKAGLVEKKLFDVGRISSISDSAGLKRCKDDWSQPPCAHAKNSCHYGGSGDKKESYAVDFGDEKNIDVLMEVAGDCKMTTFDRMRPEPRKNPTHLHISIPSCDRL